MGVVRSGTSDLDVREFLARLRSFARPDCEVYAQKLAAISELLESGPTAENVVSALGNDIRAQTAVPAALCAFLSHADSFEEAVTFAVSLGGDTDTIGAMAGAIAGAYHGLEGIPGEWLEVLENTGKGRDYVLRLAARLHEQHLELVGRQST